ncbi:MAG: type II toxin-antitoxin system RelE/ParE family toxin [Xanthomonadales bacterium]|nr:type II toxin-antitoxin system RelE/ParE family toxin [Xanthomonadales bacterium]
MRVVFRPEARLEVLEAKAWYEARVPGLGMEFARALEVAVHSANRSPEAFSVIKDDCRRVLMRRFPYSVIYRSRQGELLVVAVFHHRREPDSWRGRSGR